MNEVDLVAALARFGSHSAPPDLRRNQAWMKRAACNPANGLPRGAWWTVEELEGRDVFFPERGHVDDVDKAKWTCFTCPVRETCARYRVEAQCEYGIWAGKIHNSATPDPEVRRERRTATPGRPVPSVTGVSQPLPM